MASTVNINAIRGDTKVLTVTVKDSSGSAVNITGYTAKFTVRKNPLDSTAIISKTTSSGIVLTTPTSGIMTITLSSSDTTIDLGKYSYDVEVTDGSSQVITTTRGDFNVTYDVSR